jgi:hypothetical protein
MVLVEMVMTYTPKKQNWNSLSEFRDHLARETTEKIVLFNGHQLITETTVYGLSFGKLHINEVKRESKSTTGRSNGSTTNKERMGTHGRSDHVKPDRKKASKVCATKVSKKVSKPKKSPK